VFPGYAAAAEPMEMTVRGKRAKPGGMYT
jgi:hypothetical protein